MSWPYTLEPMTEEELTVYDSKIRLGGLRCSCQPCRDTYIEWTLRDVHGDPNRIVYKRGCFKQEERRW